MTAKEAIIEMVKQMPDDASMPDIIGKLYIRQQIDERIRQVDAGDWLDHEEVVKNFAT